MFRRKDPGDPHPWALKRSPRSWQQDYELENGNYINVCVYCHRYFMGYKRRCVCRECATPKNIPLMLIGLIIFLGGTAIFIISGLLYGFGDGFVWAYVFFCSIFAAGAGGQLLKKRRIEQEEDAKRRGL